ADGGISVGGVTLAAIATRHGTPAYVLDEDDVRQRCREYRQALPDAEIAYVGKAFLCRAMARWVDEEGLSLDVCSEGELAVEFGWLSRGPDHAARQREDARRPAGRDGLPGRSDRGRLGRRDRQDRGAGPVAAAGARPRHAG